MAINETILHKTEQLFSSHFNDTPLLVRSPGRVNIIGEHTDYNNGFVLPAAIDKAVYVAVSARADNAIELYSGEFGQHHTTTLEAMKPDALGWPNYILGVADQLHKRGFPIRGFNLVIDGDVPIGSGLSSSAAVECATAAALNHIFDLGIDKKQLALISQKAEHEFAGVMCGIMDQFASVFGKKGQVIKLDCLTLDYEYLPLAMEGYSILLLNTNVKHSLASTEYNTRRQQCEQGVEWIREKYTEVKSLRDATMEMLREQVEPRDAVIFKRCKYVVEEKQRLLDGCEDLKRGDLRGLGLKMYATHDGLSKEYEVSCPELDFLVDAVRGNEAVAGARMMGGGFGGCTINIIKDEEIDKLVARLAPEYHKATGLELTAYIAKIEDGTTILS